MIVNKNQITIITFNECNLHCKSISATEKATQMGTWTDTVQTIKTQRQRVSDISMPL